MASCPNKTFKTDPTQEMSDWAMLEDKVGKLEAYRDYMETDGQIRDPQVVADKIKLREETPHTPSNFGNNPTLWEITEKTSNTNSTGNAITLDQLKANRAIEIADKMSRALGVDYEVLTPQQAREITKASINPWTGEAAFFFGGKVYLLEGTLTTENVLHEFSHPLVRALSKENTELFNNLYDEVSQTEEGQKIISEVRKMYPELDIESADDLFKEEVIVKALTEQGKNQANNVKTKGKFAKAISNILYQLKQMLRKVFGKSIKISKLNTDTTINELAEILAEGNQIKFNIELVTEEDIVAYNRENFEQIAQELDSFHAKDMQNTVNTFYDTISKQVNALYNNKNYQDLIPILKDQYLRGDLEEIKRNLSKHQTMIMNAKNDMLADVQDTKSRAMAMTETILRLESIMQKMAENVQDLQQEGDTQENMHKAYYYGKFMNHYKILIDELHDGMRKNNIANDASIRTTVASIKRNMENAQDSIDDMKMNGARDALYDQLEPLKRNVSERYESIIQNLKDKGASKERIDKVYKEYHGMSKQQWDRFNELSKQKKIESLSLNEQNEFDNLLQKSKDGLSITKEKIEAQMRGQIGDANWFNSYLEGYMYNNDPIVGGLALFTKNALNEVMVTAQQKSNTFAEEMRDPLKRAGYNPSLLGRLGERTTFKDKIAKINQETGKVEMKEVHTFLNQFKDYRYDKALKKEAVTLAHDEYQRSNTEEAREAFLAAVADQKSFLRDYFHQEYVDEFYEKEDLLSQDDIGKEAAYLRGEFFERMNELTQGATTIEDELSMQDDIDSLWAEYAQMHSRYNLDGTLKTDRQAAIANRLREYREVSREFYEWKARKGVFENEYFNYLEELASRKIVKNSPEWKEAVENWKTANSRKVVKDEFYETRNDILFEIQEIMKKLSDTERKAIDQSAVWQDIIDNTSGFRDTASNQLNGTEMSEGAIAKIKKFQLDLEKIREAGLQRSGLTRKEETELNELYKRSKTDKTVWPRINELNAQKEQQGLNEYDVDKLTSLYAELAELSSKEATTYYAEQANGVISKIDVDKLNNTRFQKDFGNMSIDQVNAEYLLDPKYVDELSAISPEFKEWHEKNHIKKKKWNDDSNKVEDVYERLYVWSVTKPSDVNMMESYKIEDASGNVVDTVEGLPSMKYYTRAVKVKYKNRVIPGVTKDNQGQWLPKSRAEMAENTNLKEEDKYKYINEQYEALENSSKEEDKGLLEALEIMKKYHLENQEDLSYNNRLGYDVPRYRKENLELARTLAKNPLERTKDRVTGLSILAKRIKDFFVKTSDQAEDGMSYENNFNLVRADIFDNDMTGIPISGLYDIEQLDDVSMDVTTSLNRYMLSAERQKQLVKISPIVRSIQDSVNNNSIDDINKIHEKNFKATNVLKYFKKKDNVRASAINNWVEKHFEGVTQKGIGADSAFLQNFSRFMFKRASFSFFALNLPSALKNSLGMKFQSMLEASAGRYVTQYNLQKGNGWSYITMGELSANQLYKRGAQSHRQQLVQVFDPVQGRFEDKFAETLSRTAAKDAASMSWLMSPRKWVEIQAGLQLFGGMMYTKTVTQKTEKGGEAQIAYMDAFETVDGQIRLKEGIDVRYGIEPIYHNLQAGETVESIAEKYNIPAEAIEQTFKNLDIEDKLELAEEIEEERQEELDEIAEKLEQAEDEMERTKLLDIEAAINRKYDAQVEKQTTVKIDNSEFKFMKNRIQQVQNNMGGAYSNFDQPEAQRYLAFRWISYLRRYFTAMAVNRWGFAGSLNKPRPRLNPGTGDVQLGFYIQFMKTVMDTVKSLGSNLQYMQAEEKQAAMKFLVEVGSIYLMMFAMGALFGWDDKDDDRFAKLRAKSGALPIPFITNSEDRAFNMKGWLQNHALHMLMQVRAENEQFNLLTGGTKPYTSMLNLKAIVMGPTVESYEKLWTDLKQLATGDSKAYYSRDVGPFDWQKKEQAKFKGHFLKMFGLTGKTYDPALAIQNFQSFYVRSQK